jgi:hypothetical protein
MIRRDRLVAAATTLAVAMAATSAFAQASAEDRRCIQAINKGVRKIATAQTKAMRRCASEWQNGGALPVEQCSGLNTYPSVTIAVHKVLTKVTLSCGGTPPSFGPTDLSSPVLAVDAGLLVLADLFVSTDTAMTAADSPAKQSCQNTILASVQKCENVRLKSFEKCKSKGLRGGTIDSAADMEACLFDGAGQPDPAGKIARLCFAKPTLKSESRCVSKGVDLGDAFPGCGGLATSGDLATCIDRSVRCRACNLINAVDGTAVDCDVFDDGDDGNDSCPEGAVCGDGVVDGHACDDGSATAGDGCDGSTASITASTVAPSSTASPSFSSMRRNRPASGEVTTYRSRIRVRPSSSTVTCIGPRVTGSISTSTGIGQNAYTSPAATSSMARMGTSFRERLLISDAHYSRVLSTATRSRRSSSRRTTSEVLIVAMKITDAANPKVERSTTSGNRCVSLSRAQQARNAKAYPSASPTGIASTVSVASSPSRM